MYKSIFIIFTFIIICSLPLLSEAVMTLDWQDTSATIVTEDNMRNLALNPITNHLLIATSGGTERGITIIDADNGIVLGSLQAPSTGWSTDAPSPYGIAVDGNGVIYATGGFFSPVPLLQWADETSAPITIATTDITYVRSLRVVGTGTTTKLIFPSQTDQNVRIYSTSDGLTFSEQTRFFATDAIHDAISNADVTTVYVTANAAFTHKWDYIGSTWTEDSLWNQSTFISNLAFLESQETLYGAYWNTGASTTDGIRAWDANTGIETDSLDIGDTGTVSVRGNAITLHEFQTVDISPNSPSAGVGQTSQLNATANLSRKLFFAFCGGIGYGRVDLGATITGPVWASDNYSIASVDNTGLVYAISIGVCTVSATYTRDSVSYSDSVEVNIIATHAPLAPDAVSSTIIHQAIPMNDMTQSLGIEPRSGLSLGLFN